MDVLPVYILLFIIYCSKQGFDECFHLYLFCGVFLTHFSPIFHFYAPLKTAFRLLQGYRNGASGLNRLRWHYFSSLLYFTQVSNLFRKDCFYWPSLLVRNGVFPNEE